MRSRAKSAAVVCTLGLCLAGACNDGGEESQGDPTEEDADEEDPGEDPEDSESGAQPQVPLDDALVLTWENFGDGYLRNWCRGCHSSALEEEQRNGATLGVDFDTLEGVRTFAQRALERGTGDEPSMPPAGGPSHEERTRFALWLEEGALEDADLTDDEDE